MLLRGPEGLAAASRGGPRRHASNGPVTAAPAARRRARSSGRHSAAAAAPGADAEPFDPAPPVRGVVFDVDGVLCSSEHLSRQAAAQVLFEMASLTVDPDEFIPYGGQGEARFIGGVAEKYGIKDLDMEAAKERFFDIFINTYARGPSASEIGYPGAVALVRACRAAGLATAVASSAERVKVDANLAAAGFGPSDFGAVVSATAFRRNKPAPDIFLAAAEGLGLAPSDCVVLEDAPAGVAAARAAGMRVIGLATTLSRGEMAELAPDAVYDVIGQVSVEAIRGTCYTQGSGGAAPAVEAAAAAGREQR